ncbi:aldose 1-epimerase family protein [Lachnoclostridium pacaense]|uniref:aldose 1-epimerase family protein n=1 Tax=Enterocloster hominis (ex Hitch et al. 2024) TaxID=1917870 RepID=UPI001D0FC5E4|nr:aldose 1-epimerase family protein [Lachnoclostridium pacaense]MCC2816936.1 aldose 1-epimerase family protein [Lachnoclostridium pacaense]
MKWTLNNFYLNVEFSDAGGALSSIKDQEGTEYLWEGDARYWSGQAPVLFPICGSLRKDEAWLLNGDRVHMPRHGIVRKKMFTCDFCNEDTLQFSIKSDEAMYDMFPYHFKLIISYRLSGKKITVRYTIINEDTREMPFFIGGHPGFKCPILPEEQFEDYQIEFENEETLEIPEPVTETGLIHINQRKPLVHRSRVLPLTHELFHEDALILDRLLSRRVRLRHRYDKRGVEIEFREFPYLILWSAANDGPFVAMEPWSGLSTCDDEDDIFEHKRGMQKAAPGELKQLEFSITVL